MMYLFPMIDLVSLIVLVILYITFIWRVSKSKPPSEFFLLDFSCYKPPFDDHSRLYTTPNELENVVFEMVDYLFKKIKVKVEDIGILVCVFKGSSSVSLSSIIAKRYELRENIVSYDLNGKSSTAGLTAVTLAKQLLQANPDCLALVVSTEELPKGRHVTIDNPSNSSPSQYRPSGAAILLSNRTSDSPNSKFKFVRTHTAHVAVSDRPLPDPVVSAKSASDRVVESNVSFNYSVVRPIDATQRGDRSRRNKKVPMWYNVWHTSGAAMEGAVERNRKVPRGGVEASRMVVSWFGYEPISTMWYRLAYVEAKIKKGDWVSQVALVSDGFDFRGSAMVWLAIGDVDRGENKIKPLIFKLFGEF